MTENNEVLNPEVVQAEVAPPTAVVLTGTALMDQISSCELSPQDLEKRMEDYAIRLNLRSKFIADNMKEGLDKDFAKLPGCGKKNVMLQPCAEKLIKWHGYHCELNLVHSVEDRTTPYFEYRFRGIVKILGTTIVVATAERECNSKEAKFGSADPFSIKDNVLAKAQKRAYVGATRRATATSDIFAEEDGGGDDIPRGNDNPQFGAATTGDYKSLILRSMKSKYGDPDKKSKCSFCGDFHVLKGDDIVGVAGQDNKTVYGSEKCLAKQWAENHQGATGDNSPTETAQTEKKEPERTAQPTGSMLNAAQIQAIWAVINSCKKTENEVEAWLGGAFKQYAGKGINSILSADFEKVKTALTSWGKGELAV